MALKEVVASVLISAVVVSGIGYLALPVVYPSLETGDSEHTHTFPEDKGLIIQSKYIEITSQAGILDSNVNYLKIPDTEINITISDQSRIVAIFNSPYIVGMGPDFVSQRTAFNISLDIEGIGSRVARVSSFGNTGATEFREHSSTLNINYVSDSLLAGTYEINVKYKSIIEHPSLQGYLTLNIPSVNYTRSLWVMELRN
jgi:hypothetical protein